MGEVGRERDGGLEDPAKCEAGDDGRELVEILIETFSKMEVSD